VTTPTLAMPELTWLCNACQKDSDDGYCDCCGKALTAEHLAAYAAVRSPRKGDKR
jgi:predicted amidophosphoribosyltransferase